MVTRHADLPVEDIAPGTTKALEPNTRTREWQAVHDPLLTIKVWLGTGGQILTNVAWQPEVRDAEVMCKPLDDMALATLGASDAVKALAMAIAVTWREKQALEDVGVAS